MRVLEAFDDAALAAITSVGLVRRARKDLDKDAIAVDADDASARIRVGDCTVTLTASGPADARCTCPAGAKCRHVLVAVMHLKQQPGLELLKDASASVPAAMASAEQELLALTEADLSKWVGRKTLRDAMRLIDGSSDIEIVEDSSITVRFPSSSIECRYFPGTGLAGVVSTAPAKLRERFMAAAILAYQRSHGIVHEIEAPAKVQRDIEGPRTPRQVLQSASLLLEEMVTVGIVHVSGSVRDRLQTLSVSCVGGNLPRLSLLLKSLADQVSMALRRDAGANDVRLFDTMARAYALCHAIIAAGGAAPPALIGQGRSKYEHSGAMELTGVGAYAWRTRSGYHGLTVLFWDSSAKQWCSWSDSRPVSQDTSFNPLSRYEHDMPWQGSGSPRVMSRSRFRITGASRNDEDRLSGSEQCQAIILSDTEPSAIDFGSHAFDDWDRLRRYVSSVTPAGLEEHSPLERVVVLKPASWGRRVFLPAEQTLVWELLDAQGLIVMLTLPFDAISQRAVDSLEAIDPAIDDPGAIVGTVNFDGTHIRLLPYSLLKKTGTKRVYNLNLDPSPISLRTPTGDTSALSATADQLSDESEIASAAITSIFAQWSELEDELQRLAEAGSRRFSPEDRARFESAAATFAALGLLPLAACLRQGFETEPRAATLLRLRYLCNLHGELTLRLALSEVIQ